MLFGQSAFAEFGIDGLYAYFVEFVNGNGYIYHLVRCADDFGYAGKDFTVIDMQTHADT